MLWASVHFYVNFTFHTTRVLWNVKWTQKYTGIYDAWYEFWAQNNFLVHKYTDWRAITADNFLFKGVYENSFNTSVIFNIDRLYYTIYTFTTWIQQVSLYSAADINHSTCDRHTLCPPSLVNSMRTNLNSQGQNVLRDIFKCIIMMNTCCDYWHSMDESEGEAFNRPSPGDMNLQEETITMTIS